MCTKGTGQGSCIGGVTSGGRTVLPWSSVQGTQMCVHRPMEDRAMSIGGIHRELAPKDKNPPRVTRTPHLPQPESVVSAST